MIIINGKIQDNPTINFDDGFTFGKGVFETILVKNKPLFLSEHLDRLKKGISTLKINNSIEEKFVLNTIESYNINNCSLKIIITDKNTVISTRPVPYTEVQYEEGFKIKLSSIKRNPFSHFTYLKSLNYIDNMLERETAVTEGFQEVIFLNTENKLSEGSVSNIFFIKDGKLHTPSISCGLLDGIIRRWIIDNYETSEGEYSFEDLLKSDGAFLTNSLMGVMKIYSINSHILNNDSMINKIKKNYDSYICG